MLRGPGLRVRRSTGRRPFACRSKFCFHHHIAADVVDRRTEVAERRAISPASWMLDPTSPSRS